MRDQLTTLVEFLDKYATVPGRVLDVGAEGGENAKRVLKHNHIYETLNISYNPTYDVRECPYTWPVPDNTFDHVISTSTFEHIEFPWLSFLEIVRVTKPKGTIFIHVPSSGPEHHGGNNNEYPDSWRYYTDSMKSFAKWGKVELLESFIDEEPAPGMWKFCIGIFRKG